MTFPIDLSAYQPLKLSLSQESLDGEQKATLQKNINLVRDAIVFFTALANTKGLGGHTGGAYDIVPELLIADGFMKGATPATRSTLTRRAIALLSSTSWRC